MSASGILGADGLRPLTVGETFDRAITIVVRNVRQLLLVGLAFIIPFAVLQYLVTSRNSGGYQQLIDQINHPGRVVPAADFATIAGWLMLLLAFSFLATPFVNVAFAAAVATVYRGAAPRWTRCYAAGFGRTGSVLLCAAILIIVMMIAGFTGALGFGFLSVVAAFAANVSAPAAIAVFILLAAYSIAWLLAMGLVYLAQTFMLYGVVIEGLPLETAFGTGFRRIFARGEVGRAALMCLSLAAVYIAELIVSAGCGLLLATATHANVLEVAAGAFISLIFLVFFRTLLAVYYFDVRVRREGLDLEREIDALDSAASA